jgi:Ca2+-binding RTX toxin-like protein
MSQNTKIFQMDQEKKQLIEITSEKQEIGVQPGGELVFTGIDFDKVTVDIVDTDVIVRDPATGGVVTLIGLAIFLFDEEVVPLISFNGVPIAPNLLLSKVGEIGNLTVQEFVAVSSLLEKDLKTSEVEKEDADKDFEAAAEILAIITEAIESMAKAQQAVAEKVEVSKDDGKYDSKHIDDEGDKFSVAPKQPPPETPALAAAAEAPPVPQAETFFELLLLQPSKVESIESNGDVELRTILGGGGSEESTFNASNEVQFSTEVLNYGTASEDLIIQTDNPDYFDANTMTRVIELIPTFPVGFIVSSVELKGFPSGFVIEGATKAGNAYSIENPEISERGSVRLNLIYQVPSNDTFTVDFKVSAEFDPTAVDSEGVLLESPPEAIMDSEDTRDFEMRDVSSAGELNYTNSVGDEVWVLANDPNPNRVFAGSGNDQITGSVAIDFIQGGDGVDVIDGGAGNDFLNGEGGDDILLHSVGLDRLIGGTGSDTADYSEVLSDVVADLSILVDGYAEVIIGDPEDGEIDLLTTVENIRTGSGADVLIGDMEDNHLFGGGGSDRLAGGLGNDILDGGADRDIADYSANLSPIVTNLTLDEDNVFISESDTDTLINIEHVIGSDFDDVMEGGSADDTFWAGAGNDVLIGGGGSNTLDAGEGEEDIVDFSGSSSGVSVNFGGGTDGEGYVIATHGADSDRLKNIEDLVGSDHDDNLTGDEADQTIIGREGDDYIDGAGGSDILDGSLGTDELVGGSGDDLFIHSDGNDSIDGGADSDTIDFSLTENIIQVNAVLNGANDSLIVVTGGDNLTIKNIENIVGTIGDDRLQGDASDNILWWH